MRSFRQEPNIARSPGNGHPGRSYWPEPDSIRRITGKSAPQHQPEHQAGVYFPRADLGLPIIHDIRGGGEPGKISVEPAASTRMASPVIVKPLMLNNGQALPLIMLLNAPHVWDMAIKLVDRNSNPARVIRPLVVTELYDKTKSTNVYTTNAGVPKLLRKHSCNTARLGLMRYAFEVLSGNDTSKQGGF